jgi:predicted permease
MWLTFVHAVRHLRRRSALTAVGVLSLAIGIGCALACASVVNAVVFRAFPYRDPERLVLVWENNAKRGVGLTPTSILNYEDFKAATTTFERLGAFIDDDFTVDGPDGSERATGYLTTAGLLEQTAVSPLLGRLFTDSEARPGGPDVVVLSHGLWQRRFGRDPAIAGKVIRLTGVPHTIVGVMPRGFLLPPVFGVHLVGTEVVLKEADFWVPLRIDSLPRRRDTRMLFVLGRLKPGRSVDESQAEASSIARRLASDHPADDFGMDFTVVPLEKQVLTNVQTLLLLLLVVGALVLVIAATNAAHLRLVDSLTMTGETSVRSALGASPWRLASGQGTLSLVWCGLATVGALLVAAALAAPVAAYTKANVPRLNEVQFDRTVGAIAIGLGAALTFAISLLPLLYARRIAFVRSAGSTPAPVGLSRWRRLFAIVQLAVAIVVLSAAALLFRSAEALSHVNPGLVAQGVAVYDLMLPDSRYSPASRVDFQRRLLEQVAAVPGSQNSATVDYLPFDGSTSIVNFTIERHEPPDATARPRAALRAVSASYFDVLSIPHVDGRRFTAGDEAPESNVVIVNEAFARRYVTGEPAIGRRMKRGDVNSRAPWMTIVGVVGSVRSAGLGLEPQPEAFVPYVKAGRRPTLSLIVKTGQPSSSIASAVRGRILGADPALSVPKATEMTELVDRSVSQPYFYARVFGVLGVAALILSLAGVYGIAALGVSARSTEIAIRSCLGAQPSDIVLLILRETGTAVSVAVIAGAFGAVILQRRMAAFVYGVESTDWLAITISAALLSLMALGAVYLAIRRSVELRPMELLRRRVGALA